MEVREVYPPLEAAQTAVAGVRAGGRSHLDQEAGACQDLGLQGRTRRLVSLALTE